MKGYNDDVEIVVRCFENFGCIRFVFEKIAPTEMNMRLLNTFNQHQLFYKALISDRGYLMLEYCFPIWKEEEAAKNIEMFMSWIGRICEDADLLALRRATWK